VLVFLSVTDAAEDQTVPSGREIGAFQAAVVDFGHRELCESGSLSGSGNGDRELMARKK
jgi:hypothetical protein